MLPTPQAFGATWVIIQLWFVLGSIHRVRRARPREEALSGNPEFTTLMGKAHSEATAGASGMITSSGRLIKAAGASAAETLLLKRKPPKRSASGRVIHAKGKKRDGEEAQAKGSSSAAPFSPAKVSPGAAAAPPPPTDLEAPPPTEHAGLRARVVVS